MLACGGVSLALCVADAIGERDLLLQLVGPGVTVGEVLDELGLAGAGVAIDGVVVDAETRAAPAARHLAPGVRVEHLRTVGAAQGRADDTSRPSQRADAPGEPSVEMAVVAGLDAGRVMSLPHGRYRVGGTDARPGWYLAVDRPGTDPPRRVAWHDAAPNVEAVDGPGVAVAFSPPVDPQGQHIGFVHRPPRPREPDAVAPVILEEAPPTVTPPAPLSWATLLAPIPVALVMAFFFRPIFAIFAAMGPVVALGRWYEGRRRHRRALRQRTVEVERIRLELERAIRVAAEAEATRRWACQPHIGVLRKRARHRSVRLWERRPGHPGHLVVTVGVGPDHFEVPLGDGRLDLEVHDRAEVPAVLRAVPHTLDLVANLGVGFHGDRDAIMAMARAALLQVATLHGPADVRIGIVANDDRFDDWDWLKWLPHLDDRLVASTAGPIAESFGPAPTRGVGPPPIFRPGAEIDEVTLIVIDDPRADVAALHRAASDVGRTVRFVAVAPAPTLLPAVCTALVGIVDGRALVQTPQRAVPCATVMPTGVAADTAAAWSRSLAPMRDPELVTFEGSENERVPSLLQLLEVDRDALLERWSARTVGQAPVAVVGRDAGGPTTLDLTLDGPHALVAGTTGSGKSEFLRTLVLSLAAACPPDQLTFVLVDFKGGGAFDACATLPHVAGLITDLDEHLVARAINSLRAELVRRETLLRELGVSSYREAAGIVDEPLARLVIVIDEFAVLATDHAELMASIIDLAARGRSLGMHLVLATQRPSGVVDQKIRANTNLRVALRVQDPHDSHDVIGSPAAASIDRKSPGQAMVSIGGDTPFAVQCAFTGSPDRRGHRVLIGEHRLRPAADARDAVADRGAECDSAQATDRSELEVLVAEITNAAYARGCKARPLWADPLPDTLDWIDLGARSLGTHAVGVGLALGLADMPERQTQLPWRWNPEHGALVLYGASSTMAGRLLRAAGTAVAATAAPDDAHLYVIDGDAGNASPLAGLAHTGAYVRHSEIDRVERTLTLVERILAERQRSPAADGPRVFLFIDNLAGVLSIFDDPAKLAFVERLASIARDGAPLAVHLAVTARTPRDVSHRLAQQIPTRLVGDLADPGGYLVLGMRASQVVDLPDMRVIDLATNQFVQLVEPPKPESVAVQRPTDMARAPQGVPSLPTSIDARELASARRLGDELHLPIGLDAELVEPVTLILRPSDDLLVVGPHGSGRTSFLTMVAQQLQSIDGVRALGFGSPPGALGLDVSSSIDADGFDELQHAATPTIVLVDDAVHLDTADDQALRQFVTVRRPHVRLVIATTTEHARSLRCSIAPLRDAATGLLLGGRLGDGDVLKVRRPPLDGLGRIVGRAHLVARGRVTPLQVAHHGVATPPDTHPHLDATSGSTGQQLGA